MLKKVIVSHRGEVLEDTRIAGDRIRYRIRYSARLEQGARQVISDRLPKGLTDVEVFDGGTYDPLKHTVTWPMRPHPVSLMGTMLEFEATLASPGTVENQAALTAHGPRPTRSNKVKTVVREPPRMGWIPLQPDVQPGEPARVYLKDETSMGVTVRFDFPGLFVFEQKVDGVAYHRLALPGRAALTDAGKPELPIAGELVEVPFGAHLWPEIVEKEGVVLEGYNVYPAQPPRPERVRGKEPFVLDAEAYGSDADYPGVLAVAEDKDAGVIRGHRIAALKVNPVQYNPVTGRLTVYSMIEVRLSFDRPAQIGGVDSRLVSEDFEELLKASVLNYKPQERFAKPEGGGGEGGGEKELTGYDYLIITADGLYDPADATNPIVKLADWKRRKGLRVKVKKVGSIAGGNTAASIQTYIQNAYDTWNPAPSYVLLVGDSDTITAVPGMDHPDATMPRVNTDLYYTTVDGTDYFPDIHVGRLSADTKQQLSDIVDKILAYEKNPPAQAAFYDAVSLVGLFTDDGSGGDDFAWIGNQETLRDFLLNQVGNVERIYCTDSGFPGNPAAQQPQTYQDGTALPANLLWPNYAWNGDTAMISAAMNAGRFLISYRAHGSWDGWSQPAFTRADVAALNQNDRTPVVFSFTCQTCWFDNEIDDHTHGGRPAADDCYGEAHQRRARAGAVAIMGMTRNSYPGYNDFIVWGMVKGLWPAFVPNPPWAAWHPAIPNLTPVPLRRMGQLLNLGKMYMARAYGAGDTTRQLEFEMGHLLGDPEMPIWIGEPQTLDVAHPDGIGRTGLQEFAVRVQDANTHLPVPNATVVLTHDSDIVAMVQTDTAGIARFSFPAGGAAPMDITVTALGYRPYEGKIDVKPDGASLGLAPADGPEGQVFRVVGNGFGGGEQVSLHFDGGAAGTATADGGGSFGYAAPFVEMTVPAGQALGPVNVEGQGQTSGRYALRIFRVRGQNPVDLYTYAQDDHNTWWLHPGDNPTWDSPDIQLYDQAGNPVDSNNLVFGNTYTVHTNVRNAEAFDAQQAHVVFRWRDYGAGGPWTDFHTVALDVPRNPPGLAEATADFTPVATGHVCIKVTLEHLEDINEGNNEGQENLHIGYTSSPAKVCFAVWNTSKYASPVFVEVRQLVDPKMHGEERLWPTWVDHPRPQILKPDERAEVCVIVDPEKADIKAGTTAEFAVTCFVGSEMIGGVNLRITAK